MLFIKWDAHSDKDFVEYWIRQFVESTETTIEIGPGSYHGDCIKTGSEKAGTVSKVYLKNFTNAKGWSSNEVFTTAQKEDVKKYTTNYIYSYVIPNYYDKYTNSFKELKTHIQNQYNNGTILGNAVTNIDNVINWLKNYYEVSKRSEWIKRYEDEKKEINDLITNVNTNITVSINNQNAIVEKNNRLRVQVIALKNYFFAYEEWRASVTDFGIKTLDKVNGYASTETKEVLSEVNKGVKTTGGISINFSTAANLGKYFSGITNNLNDVFKGSEFDKYKGNTDFKGILKNILEELKKLEDEILRNMDEFKATDISNVNIVSNISGSTSTGMGGGSSTTPKTEVNVKDDNGAAKPEDSESTGSSNNTEVGNGEQEKPEDSESTGSSNNTEVGDSGETPPWEEGGSTGSSNDTQVGDSNEIPPWEEGGSTGSSNDTQIGDSDEIPPWEEGGSTGSSNDTQIGDSNEIPPWEEGGSTGSSNDTQVGNSDEISPWEEGGSTGPSKGASIGASGTVSQKDSRSTGSSESAGIGASGTVSQKDARSTGSSESAGIGASGTVSQKDARSTGASESAGIGASGTVSQKDARSTGASESAGIGASGTVSQKDARSTGASESAGIGASETVSQENGGSTGSSESAGIGASGTVSQKDARSTGASESAGIGASETVSQENGGSTGSSESASMGASETVSQEDGGSTGSSESASMGASETVSQEDGGSTGSSESTSMGASETVSQEDGGSTGASESAEIGTSETVSQKDGGSAGSSTGVNNIENGEEITSKGDKGTGTSKKVDLDY